MMIFMGACAEGKGKCKEIYRGIRVQTVRGPADKPTLFLVCYGYKILESVE